MNYVLYSTGVLQVQAQAHQLWESESTALVTKRSMEDNHQNLEAKHDTATVIPRKMMHVKKKMFDQVVRCVTSCCGRITGCSATSQSSNSEQPK